ncbi:MAG: ABC transporter ATP-binding protein [Firmicutes bacterium]|nr:ABC transporter ATP-binding protein [Bacillota bacterium]
MAEPVVELVGVSKEYQRGGTGVKAVDGVSLTVRRGEFVVVMGKSGSGKSTLLHLMSGLQNPTGGRVRLLGRETSQLSDDALTLIRRDGVGFIFQFFNLLPTMNALENVSLPLLLARMHPAKARERAKNLLDLVGLADRAAHRPDELSGGQLQRVAIARALVAKPHVLFADEPTGNLDSVAGEEILALLKDTQSRLGQTIVMVTHDPRAAAFSDRLIILRDGKVIENRDPRTVAGAAAGVAMETPRDLKDADPYEGSGYF